MKFDPAKLAEVGKQLQTRIPSIPEFERLHLWPWWPWEPWWDCNPDIIFRVTQVCQDQNKVIVDEGIWDVRWDIPTTLNVTLTANDQACCIQDPPPPEGNCMLIMRVCGDSVASIGGNIGAAPNPAGFLSPGAVSDYGDRPYGGSLLIEGDFGTASNADYYEFEFSSDGGITWKSVPTDYPLAAVSGFTREYWGPKLGGGPINVYDVPFNYSLIGGRYVIESREHFEANNAPGTWGVLGPNGHWWISGAQDLTWWNTAGVFTDGNYLLRVRSWKLADLLGGANISDSDVLPICDTEELNYATATIDNRFIGPDVPGVCGPGTVHICTDEPDTEFYAVRILDSQGHVKTGVGACSNITIAAGDVLQVDIAAYDPDGHLAEFSLQATYGNGLVRDLLSQPSSSLTSLGGMLVPMAAQAVSDYAAALGGGATSPIWNGGAMRLEVLATDAFPETCCYQLELRAWKRTVVNCDHGREHWNLSEYSFGVTV